MNSVTIRLDEKLEKLLEEELKLEKKSRSDLVRDALQEYLKRHKRERFMQTLVQEMKSLSPEARQEGLDLVEEALPLDNEALDLAEGRKPGEPWPEETGEKWWK